MQQKVISVRTFIILLKNLKYASSIILYSKQMICSNCEINVGLIKRIQYGRVTYTTVNVHNITVIWNFSYLIQFDGVLCRLCPL